MERAAQLVLGGAARVEDRHPRQHAHQQPGAGEDHEAEAEPACPLVLVRERGVDGFTQAGIEQILSELVGSEQD